MKRLLKANELYVFLVLAAVTLIIQLVSGQFYTANNLVDIVRSFIPSALFAMGLMVVLISGGIDLSFPAVGALASYVVMLVTDWRGGEGNVLLGYLCAVLLGAALGAVNGFFVAKFKFPHMIVTLATSSIFTGIMQGVLRCHEIYMPENYLALGKSTLFVVENQSSGMKAAMPATVLFLIGFAVIGYFLLHRTMLGRSIYAIGGDIQSAQRAGYNVFASQMFVFCFAGGMAAFAGYTKHIMNLYMVPTSIIGTETDIIAGVVLGGVRITGGVGSITGAFGGVMMLTVVRNSLLLLNVPTYWQTLVTAVFIILGTGISAVQILMARRKGNVDVQRGALGNA